jgi:hypothetical protein
LTVSCPLCTVAPLRKRPPGATDRRAPLHVPERPGPLTLRRSRCHWSGPRWPPRSPPCSSSSGSCARRPATRARLPRSISSWPGSTRSTRTAPASCSRWRSWRRRRSHPTRRPRRPGGSPRASSRTSSRAERTSRSPSRAPASRSRCARTCGRWRTAWCRRPELRGRRYWCCSSRVRCR